jgi:Fur family ferric uptake transcriptional regulator
LICKTCGKTVEIEANEVEAWAEKVAKQHGFREPSHMVEIFGLCSDC